VLELGSTAIPVELAFNSILPPGLTAVGLLFDSGIDQRDVDQYVHIKMDEIVEQLDKAQLTVRQSRIQKRRAAPRPKPILAA
jgi:hypothetical protein